MTSLLDDHTLQLSEWHTPATDYPECEVGRHRIHHGRYMRGHYRMYGLDGHLLFEATKPLVVTTLQEWRGKRWHQWMVDDPPHWRAMQKYAEAFYGDVLVAGLGLGLFWHAIAQNPRVRSLTVVELSQDVISLVGPLVPECPFRVALVQGDFWEYLPNAKKIDWDWIMVDLWVARGAEQKLHLYYHEVIPRAVQMSLDFPRTKFVFHGFSTVTDVELVTPEMMVKLREMNAGLEKHREEVQK